MSFKFHEPSKTIDKIANTIGQDLARITDEIQRNRNDIDKHQEDSDDEYEGMHDAFDEMNRKVNNMIQEVKTLQIQAAKNTHDIKILLEQEFKPIPTLRADSTETVNYDNYKPKHPVLKEVSSAKSFQA